MSFFSTIGYCFDIRIDVKYWPKTFGWIKNVATSDPRNFMLGNSHRKGDIFNNANFYLYDKMFIQNIHITIYFF